MVFLMNDEADFEAAQHQTGPNKLCTSLLWLGCIKNAFRMKF